MNKKLKDGTLFLGIALLLAACGTGKILVGSGDIETKDVYTQKYVPGMEDAEVKEYLFIEYLYLADRDVVVDSVQFRNGMYHIRPRQKEFRIDLSKKKELFLMNSEELLPEEAMLYYHVGEEIYKQKLAEIGERETVYMP